MSDLIVDLRDAELAPVNVPASSTAGVMLRSAREAQGLHIGALAVALKVPVKKLEALEADRFDQLPDMVFVRSLALSVCRVLKIDATPIMSALPQLHPPQIKTDESGLNASFNTSTSVSNYMLLSKLASPFGVGVTLVLLAIAAVLFWPTKPIGIADSVLGSRGPAIPASVAVSENTTSEAVVSASALSAEVAERPNAPTEPASLSTSALTGITSTGGVSGAVSATTESSILTLTAHGVSWVEVTDAKGASRMRKITSNGEVLQISGELPLSVVLGRADLIAVSVRGQPFDIAGTSKDNVARFEVK
jgi:cytoskeleton protein RodZ